jgi:hypothetical protein
MSYVSIKSQINKVTFTPINGINQVKMVNFFYQTGKFETSCSEHVDGFLVLVGKSEKKNVILFRFFGFHFELLKKLITLIGNDRFLIMFK